jgi:ABC-2 type transport system permease protein
MTGWGATWLVAVREAKERARSKAFLASTAVTLLLLAGVVAVVALTDSGPPTYRVAFVGDTPEGLDAAVSGAAVAADALVEQVDAGGREAVADALENGDLDAAVLDDTTILFGAERPGQLETVLEIALRQARLVERLEAAGIDTATTAELFAPDGGISDEGIAFAAIILLFIVITTYGQWVLMGVLEEKSTRVVELVVSATSVRSLLAGKVLGIGFLGLAQLVVIVTIAITAGTALDLYELPGSTAATASWAIVWFVLGFAFYAVLNAAAGSLVSRTEDAQAAATPIALVAVASYLLSFTVIMPNPDSLATRILSWLPPIAPIAFPARIAITGVPLWEILVGVAIMVAAVLGVMRLSARIYAGALLASGGRVKLADAWRAAGELTARRS